MVSDGVSVSSSEVGMVNFSGISLKSHMRNLHFYLPLYVSTHLKLI